MDTTGFKEADSGTLLWCAAAGLWCRLWFHDTCKLEGIYSGLDNARRGILVRHLGLCNHVLHLEQCCFSTSSWLFCSGINLDVFGTLAFFQKGTLVWRRKKNTDSSKRNCRQDLIHNFEERPHIWTKSKMAIFRMLMPGCQVHKTGFCARRRPFNIWNDLLNGIQSMEIFTYIICSLHIYINLEGSVKW